MKNRRLALVAFLLCACMIVGVGYAALAVQLTIEGTASFHNNATTGLEENVHFTGNTVIKDAAGNIVATKDTDVVTIDVTAGKTTAALDINFVGNQQTDPFYKEGKYNVTVYYEFEVVTKGADLTVAFGDLALSGAVGERAIFVVDSSVKQSDKTTAAPEKVTLNADGDNTVKQTFWLQVVVTLTADNQTNDIDTTAFQIVLPVTKVETTTNE